VAINNILNILAFAKMVHDNEVQAALGAQPEA
jgi:hypothetical protein